MQKCGSKKFLVFFEIKNIFGQLKLKKKKKFFEEKKMLLLRFEF